MSNILIYTVRRLLSMILVVYLITTLVFFLAHLSPFDPVKQLLGDKLLHDPRQYYRLRHLFGLDEPIWKQYLDYMWNLLHGQLGYSQEAFTLGQPVATIIRLGLPVSLKLGFYSLVLALLVGLPVGFISAVKQNSLTDHGSQFVMMLLWAVPPFVVAPIAQLIFGVELKWLPVSGWGDPGMEQYKEMVLPVTLFAAGISGYFAKSFRSFLLEVLTQDYIRTARAKGLKERTVIYLHAGKNALIPLASIVGPTVAYLVTGAFIFEQFFSIPGIGHITATAVINSDYPVIEATTILVATAVVVVNFLTDIFYMLIDPRVRLQPGR